MNKSPKDKGEMLLHKVTEIRAENQSKGCRFGEGVFHETGSDFRVDVRGFPRVYHKEAFLGRM